MKTGIAVFSLVACLMLSGILPGIVVAADDQQDGSTAVEEAGGAGMETYDQPADVPVEAGDYETQGGEVIPGEEGQIMEGGDAAGQWEVVPPGPDDQDYYQGQEEPLPEESEAVEGQEYMHPDEYQEMQGGPEGQEMAPEEQQGQ